MAPNKPAPRNWNDVQLVLATMAMALTLGLWNLFAQPDHVAAKESQPVVVPPPTQQPAANLPPTPLPQVKIMLGGVAPQTVVTVNTARGGGGGGGGGSVPSTGGGSSGGGGGGSTGSS